MIRGGARPFSLLDVARLAEAIKISGDVSLVIVDPVAALLGRVDTWRDNEVRAALQPLVDLARDTGVAVLAVLHLRKSEAQRALYRVGGSIGFVGLARSVLLAAVDPEDGRRAIAPIKCNLTAKPSPIEYRIDDEGRFCWGSATDDLNAERLLRSVKGDRGESKHEAEIFFREALASGPRPAREVMAEASDAGISRETAKRARKALEVASNRVGGLGAQGVWMLSLPLTGAKGLTRESTLLDLLVLAKSRSRYDRRRFAPPRRRARPGTFGSQRRSHPRSRSGRCDWGIQTRPRGPQARDHRFAARTRGTC